MAAVLQDVPPVPAADTLLSVEQVNLRYGQSQILWNMNLAVRRGSCTCLMGRNGMGKTTLIKSMLGIVRPRHGRILVPGLRPPPGCPSWPGPTGRPPSSRPPPC